MGSVEVFFYLYLFITVLAVIGVTVSIVLATRSQGINGSQYMAITHIFLLLYLLLLLNSAVSADPVIRYFSLLLRLLALSLASLFNLLYAISFTGFPARLRQFVLLGLGTAATISLIITDPAHHLVVVELLPVNDFERVFEAARFGPGYILYGILSLLGCIVPAGLFLRFAQTHSGRQALQARYMGLANITIIVPYLVYGLTLLLPVPTLPPPLPIAVVVASVWLYVVFYRKRLFDILPLAYTSLIQQIEHPILVADGDGTLVYMNPAAEGLFNARGITAGRSKLDDLPGIPLIWRRALEQGHRLTFEWEISGLSSEETAVFSFTLSQIASRHRTRVGYTLVGTDVTESRLSMTRQLQLETERARSEFLATFIPVISHELRTPLTAINVASHIVERSPDDALRKDKLREIVANSMRIGRIVSEIQELVSLDSPTTDSAQLVDMGEVVRALPEGINILIQQAKLMYRPIIEAQRTVVFGNRRLLLRALHSLIDNAVRHSPPGGTITVVLRQRGHQLAIAVQDEGTGIEPEQMPRLFQPFYKANEARTADGSGAGLGLTLAERIARRHGGSLEVVSAPGQGSTFTLLLPLYLIEFHPPDRGYSAAEDALFGREM
jgi:signal transduction histidine kinase